MAKFQRIEARYQGFIEEQKLFFVATAANEGSKRRRDQHERQRTLGDRDAHDRQHEGEYRKQSR
ncbi:MAG: hypothetical protein ACE5KS_04800 [Woeseiaceae bacterium]